MDDLTVPVVNRVATIPNRNLITTTMKVTADGAELVNNKDYVLTFDEDFPVITLLLAGSAAESTELVVSGDQVDPSMITEDTVIGGYDAETGTESGLEAIRKIYPVLNVVGAVLAAPGFSHHPKVAAVMQSKCEHINGNFTMDCLIDVDTEKCKRYDDIQRYKEELGVSSKHAYVIWYQWLKRMEKCYMALRLSLRPWKRRMRRTMICQMCRHPISWHTLMRRVLRMERPFYSTCSRRTL